MSVQPDLFTSGALSPLHFEAQAYARGYRAVAGIDEAGRGPLAGPVVAAAVILWTGWMAVDPLLSVLVALLILRSAWFVVKESGHILLEGTPADRDVDAIREAILREVPEARDVHHIHLWSLTPDHPVLTLHVEVAPETDCAVVLARVKAVLVGRFDIDHSTVQVEPSCCADRIDSHVGYSTA